MDDFEDWVRAGYPRAYHTACLLLGNPAAAEEVVQEAYLRAWRLRNAMPGRDHRTAWLYRVLINSCRSLPRAGRVARSTGLPAALAVLPEELRVAVVLRSYVGLADREIGVAVQRRPRTVRARLSEARRLLAADPSLSSGALTPAHRNAAENANVERRS